VADFSAALFDNGAAEAGTKAAAAAKPTAAANMVKDLRIGSLHHLDDGSCVSPHADHASPHAEITRGAKGPFRNESPEVEQIAEQIVRTADRKTWNATSSKRRGGHIARPFPDVGLHETTCRWSLHFTRSRQVASGR
jgi:hypothetical protein